MVAAAVLVLAAVGVLAGIDGSSKVSAQNRSRSVAAGLAEQDLERMRSMTATGLSNYHTTRTVTVGSTPYTVASRAEWVRDNSGTVSCTSDTSQVNYLAITSTVTWPNMGPVKPITQRSLAVPPPGVFGPTLGTAAVQIVDRNGHPQPGVPVSISGPASLGDVTNQAGCAIFGAIPAGSYQVSFQQPGYVDPSGANTVTKSVSVTAQSTSLFTFNYDRAAQLTVRFDTQVAGAWQPAQAQSFSAAGSSSPQTYTTGSSNAADSISASVYPTAYAIYAGNCSSADPRNAPASISNYFAANPGQITAGPGGTVAVTVHEPAVNVLVQSSAGVTIPGAHVVLTATGTGCSGTYRTTTPSNGTPASLGVPFGTYSVCADDGAKHKVTATVTNDKLAGTPTQTLKLGATATANCP